MKIVYLHQYFNTRDASGGTRSYEFAKRLVQLGHEVHMITSYRGAEKGSKWFQTVEDGINVHWLPVQYSNHMTFHRRLIAFARFALFSSWRATFVKGDVVFATSTPLTIAIPALVARRFGARPLVFEVRDLWPSVPVAIGALKNPLAIFLARALERYVYKKSERIVALSPGMKEGILRCGIDSKKVEIITNSADLDLFCRSPGKSEVPWLDDLGDRKIVLYAGTFGKINGVGYLVDVAAALLPRNVSIAFVAVGDGAEYESVRNRAKELDVLGNNFFIFPSVSKKLVPALFSRADMVLSLVVNVEALWANSANKFFDGLAAGRPVVLNYEGWQADILRQEGAGFTISPDEPNLAASRIIDAFENSESVEEMGRNARGVAERLFSRELAARKLESILLAAVGN